MVLLADLTVSGCLITKVVNKGWGPRTGESGGGWRLRVGDHHHVVRVSGCFLYFWVVFHARVFSACFLFLVDHCVAPFGLKNTSYL